MLVGEVDEWVLLRAHLYQGLVVIGPLERPPPRNQMHGKTSEAPDISLCAIWLAVYHLWRHVPGGPADPRPGDRLVD